AKDLTTGQLTDSPTQPFGGMDEVSVSPDGKTVAFVARVAGRENAWRTGTDAFLVASDGGSKPVNITAENPAYDFAPTFSPDGRSIAVRMMKRAGFEADRQRIGIIDAASHKLRVLTESW